MSSLLKHVSENLESDLDSDLVQSKLDTEQTEVRVKDVGIYRHPLFMYRQSKNTYLDTNTEEELNFTEYSLYKYPTVSKNFTVLPFLGATDTPIESASDYNYREFVNWVSKTPDILQEYYDKPSQYCTDFVRFNNIGTYDRGQLTSVLSLSITFEDTETGLLYTGITPIYDKPFSVEQLLKSESKTESTDEEEETIEIKEFSAELSGRQLTTEDWSISLEQTYSVTWYTLPLFEYATEDIYNWQLSFIESMVESSGEWFEVTGTVKTTSIKYNDILTIEFPFGIKQVPWTPSLTEETYTKKYLKSYDPETNTVTVELRSFGHGPLTADRISNETGLSNNKEWLIRPKT